MRSTALPGALQTGARVLVRAPRPDDAEEFLALNQASARHYAGWVSPPVTPEQFDLYLQQCGRSDFRGFFVCRRDDGHILGVVNLSQIFLGNFRSCYMGYYVGALHAGRGYMTEGVGLVLRHAFGSLGLHRVEANIQPGNAASIGLVRRLGFTLEGYSRRYLKIAGRWRDHERWAILMEDWRAGAGARGGREKLPVPPSRRAGSGPFQPTGGKDDADT